MSYLVEILAMSGELPASSTLCTPERALALLNKQNEHFIPRVEHVSPHVYVAIGYNDANMSMIVGDDGVIIIDTLICASKNDLDRYKSH